MPANHVPFLPLQKQYSNGVRSKKHRRRPRSTYSTDSNYSQLPELNQRGTSPFFFSLYYYACLISQSKANSVIHYT